MRAKRKVGESITRTQMEETLGNYAQLDAQLEEQEALLKQDIKTLKEQAKPYLDELKAKKKALLATLQLWAEQNREEFVQKKSIQTLYGILGFRTGMPQLKPRKGFKLANILELVQSHLPQYVRTRFELDRENLIAHRHQIKEAEMERCGFEIVQEESFFVEPKKEQSEV